MGEIGAQGGGGDGAQVAFGDGHGRRCLLARRVGEGEDDVGVQQVDEGRVVGVHDREDRHVLAAGQLAQDLAGLGQVLAGEREAGVVGALQAVDDHEGQVVGERRGVSDSLGGQVAAVVDEQGRVAQSLDDLLLVLGEDAGPQAGVVAMRLPRR